MSLYFSQPMVFSTAPTKQKRGSAKKNATKQVKKAATKLKKDKKVVANAKKRVTKDKAVLKEKIKRARVVHSLPCAAGYRWYEGKEKCVKKYKRAYKPRAPKACDVYHWRHASGKGRMTRCLPIVHKKNPFYASAHAVYEGYKPKSCPRGKRMGYKDFSGTSCISQKRYVNFVENHAKWRKLYNKRLGL